MTLVKYFPKHNLYPERGLDSFVNRFFDNNIGGEIHPDFNPNVNIGESEKQYSLSMDIPGMDKDAIKISVEKNILKVSGEKAKEVENEGEKYHLIERRYGKFERSFRLPEDADNNSIKAAVENGVLTISIDKAEEKLPKLIDIDIK